LINGALQRGECAQRTTTTTTTLWVTDLYQRVSQLLLLFNCENMFIRYVPDCSQHTDDN